MILLPEEWFSKYTNMLEMGVQTEKGFRLKHTFIGVVETILNTPASKPPTFKKEIRNIHPPKGLKAQLRPYQQKGFSWMVHLNKGGFGGCLADDMGLGKTLQTLTLLQYIYKPISPTARQTADITVSSPAIREAKADTDGQFSLFSFDSDNELLPQPHEIRGKDMNPGKCITTANTKATKTRYTYCGPHVVTS